MSNKKERNRIKNEQRNRFQWLISAGVILVLIAGAWITFSNRQSSGNAARPISQLTTSDFHSLAFSVKEPETIYFGHHDGLMVSRNGGKDWGSTTLSQADAMALALPSSDPSVMYAAGHDVFSKSVDGGETWQSVSTNLPGTDIHGFAVNPEDAAEVYAQVVGYGIFGSKDGGNTWVLLSNSGPPSIFNLAVGENSETLYAAAGDAGLWRSQNGGTTWAVVKNTPDSGVIALTYVQVKGRLYVTTLGDAAGLYVSEDNGESWKPAGINGILLAVTISPLDADHMIVFNDQGEVFASRDGGLSWSDQ
jgi:photosystem II stability/assembly factor-like uncharacterized protein